MSSNEISLIDNNQKELMMWTEMLEQLSNFKDYEHLLSAEKLKVVNSTIIKLKKSIEDKIERTESCFDLLV